MSLRRRATARTVEHVTPLETNDIKSQVHAVLTRQLRFGKASMASVAQALGVSEATLRRRLLQEATSFSRMLDEVRFALARRYLADPTLQLNDVAHLLGFRDPEALTQAFTRWAGGSTPDAYRQSWTQQ
jgi:AraC-like DNA-binding protein